MPSSVSFDGILINGSVGTGKTTTATALGAELQRQQLPGAVIDVDWLRRCWPSELDDPYHAALALENLEAVARNFRRRGARVLVAAGVVEDTAQLHRTAAALASTRLLHIRLTADADAVRSRLARRHADDEDALRWHARRHPELALVLDGARFVDEVLIDTTHQSVTEVVQQIMARLHPVSTD